MKRPLRKLRDTRQLAKPKKVSAKAEIERAWWEKEGEEVGDALADQISKIEGQQGGISMRNYRAARLYGGHGFISAGRFGSSAGASWGVNSGGYFGSYTSPRYNLIYAMVNTVLARLIAPGLPGVRIITNEGDWDLQERAQLLECFVEGLFYQCGTEEEAIAALKDALVFGTGFVMVDTDANGRLVNRRLFPECVWTEMYDGKDGKPRCLYVHDLMDRDELLARFTGADDQEAIMKAHALATAGRDKGKIGSRSVVVFRGWHLPSSEKAKDGREVLSINGHVLLDREYKRNRFPVAVLRFDDLLSGFLGRGMAELLYPHQAALSAIQRAEYYAWSQTALPRLWINVRSKINELHMQSSRSGGIIRGVGEPPQVLNWSATHPNFVEYKQWVIQSAYEFMGISQMSSSGNKPAGLNSGAAQREYMDIQVERFSVLAHKWEKFWVDIAEIDIDAARENYSEAKEYGDKPYVVSAPDGFVSKIKWKDVDMDRDSYWMKAYPVSSLPHSPAGRLAMVSELMQANLITRDEGLKLLKFPDLDETLALNNAMQDYAKRNAWLILRRGELPAYDSIVNLQQCVTELQKAATRAMNGGLSQSSKQITAARNWIVGAQRTLKVAAASQMPPPPPATPPGGAPMARGAPAPVSTDLPFARAA